MGEPDTVLGLQQASMLTRAGVLVLRFDVEGPPEKELLGVDSDPPRPPKESGRDKYFDAVLCKRGMARRVLTLEVGVDRHLSTARSRERRDKVQSHHAAPAPREFDRLRRE